MAPDFHIASLGSARPQGGAHSQADERRRSREQRLRSLLLAIQSGPVDAARLAFTTLIMHDAELSHDGVISGIGTALQSSHLADAWRIAQELRGRYPLAFTGSVALPGAAKLASPRGFFGGFSGRIFDHSA